MCYIVYRAGGARTRKHAAVFGTGRHVARFRLIPLMGRVCVCVCVRFSKKYLTHTSIRPGTIATRAYMRDSPLTPHSRVRQDSSVSRPDFSSSAFRLVYRGRCSKHIAPTLEV